MTRRRRATPRLYKLAAWRVQRLPRFLRGRGEPLRDVTMLTLEGEWEHGQHQELRIPFPTEQVRGLAHDLLVAEAEAPARGDVGQVPAARPGLADTPVPVAASSGTTGVVAGPGPGPAVVASGQPSSRSGPIPYRRALLNEQLERQMDRHFTGRARARDAWLQTGLRRHDVGAVDDLPIEALAGLVNQLLATPISRSTPQGDTPHDDHPTDR